MAGWVVTAAASRAATGSLSQTGHFLLSGALGGLFLGASEGMMEESNIKTIRGATAGALGGLFGSVVAANMISSNDPNVGIPAVMATFSCAGAAIGLVSSLMEKKRERYLAGMLSGFLGGLLGGWLGYQMYASLMDIAKPTWAARRIIEGLTGGILGAVFWAILGLGEKLFVFKRRIVQNVSYKECDLCHHTNILRAWYCAACGAVLQVSAPPEKLSPPRRPALVRFISACQYLGRLVATTCTVVAILAGVLLGSINIFLGLFGMLATCLVGYIGYVLFNAVADALTPFL